MTSLITEILLNVTHLTTLNINNTDKNEYEKTEISKKGKCQIFISKDIENVLLVPINWILMIVATLDDVVANYLQNSKK